MPLTVRLKVIFIVFLYLSLFVLSVLLSVYLNPVLIAIPVILLVLGIYLVFIFYPKFDPTGFTLYRLKKGKNNIAFTFDDGPDPFVTPVVLDILKEYSVKATFFCLGFKAEKYPDIIRRIREEGHILANHGYSHTKLHNKSYGFILSEIERSEKVLEPLSLLNGKRLFRSPHGFKNFTLMKILKRNNYILAGWTRGIWDSDGSEPEILLRRALHYLEDGVIFLFHDGRDIEGRGMNIAEFLRKFIPLVREKGYNITDNLSG